MVDDSRGVALDQPADIISAGESKQLCDTFVEYFTVKIRTIKSSIKSRLAGASRVYDALYADLMHTVLRYSPVRVRRSSRFSIGPLLFTLYVSPTANIISRFVVNPSPVCG